MPKVRELPPPPENPERSPPVVIPGEMAVELDGFPGEPSLEALVRISPSASRVVVLCHPHPVYGGSMHSAVPLAIAKVIAEKHGDNVGTVRFNYRGVGKSEGSFDHGRGETFDARAAIRFAKAAAPNAAMALCGYSFGTWVGLRAAAMERGIDRVALVAPAVRIFEFVKEDADSLRAAITVYIGDNDEFCDVDEAEALAKSIGAPCEVFPGSDHYFLKSRRKLAEAVVPFLCA